MSLSMPEIYVKEDHEQKLGEECSVEITCNVLQDEFDLSSTFIG